jgi:hypothetical protein
VSSPTDFNRMRRTQAASRSGGVDKNFKRGFGCMVWELIAWIVPGYRNRPTQRIYQGGLDCANKGR